MTKPIISTTGRNGNKDQYGGNSAATFIDDYITSHRLQISPEVREILIRSLEAEEAKLLAPIRKEVFEKQLKDEDDATYFGKLGKRAEEFAAEDKNRPRYKTLTVDDKVIMDIHKKDVNGVEITDGGPVFEQPDDDVVAKLEKK